MLLNEGEIMLKYEKNERVHSDLLGHILDYGYLSDAVTAVSHGVTFGNRLFYLFREACLCLVNILEIDISGHI